MNCEANNTIELGCTVDILPCFNSETHQRDIIDEVALCEATVVGLSFFDGHRYADVTLRGTGAEWTVNVGRLRRTR